MVWFDLVWLVLMNVMHVKCARPNHWIANKFIFDKYRAMLAKTHLKRGRIFRLWFVILAWWFIFSFSFSDPLLHLFCTALGVNMKRIATGYGSPCTPTINIETLFSLCDFAAVVLLYPVWILKICARCIFPCILNETTKTITNTF